MNWLLRDGTVQYTLPDDAYHFVSENISQHGAKRIRNTRLGQIFDKVLQTLGEDPDEIWDKAVH